MATTFPTSIQDLDATRGSNNDKLSTPNHVTHHTTEDDTIEALQAKVGVDGSAVTTSHDYKLSTITGSNKAVSNVSGTLTTPIINVGSDAEGDTYYRNSSGAFTRLARGADNYIMKMNGNVPNWEAETSNADASYSTKGIVQGLTDADTSGLTITAGVISVNSGTSANNIVKLNGSAQLPAVSGALLTNLTNPAVYSSGNATRDLTTATGTQTIAHGLAKTPKYIRITYKKSHSNQTLPIGLFDGVGTYNGSTYANTYNGADSSSTGPNSLSTFQSTSNIIVYTAGSGGSTIEQAATVSALDATNITLSWTKTGSPTGTLLMTWEAFA